MTVPRLPDTPAFFLDFDGCLVAIAPRPDRVRVPRQLVETLWRLHARARGALALVTGRPVADLRGLLPALSGVPIVGSHGAERSLRAGKVERITIDRRLLAELTRQMAEIADQIPGTHLERKPVGVGLHYRAVPRAEARIQEAARRVVETAEGFHLHQSKMLVELRPDGIGKGRAVSRLLLDRPFNGRVPVVMGDDLTDEPAFLAANARGGVSVKVGQGESAARHRLPDPERVRALLTRWSLREGWG